VARDPERTRQAILDAAARLFAERGIDAVSLNEINTAAGQRNASSLHYHFGSRDGLLHALLQRHVPAIGERRRALLATARGDGAELARAGVVAFVEPMAGLLVGDWRDRAFVRIAADLRTDPSRSTAEVDALVGDSSGREAFDVVVRAGGLPDGLVTRRVRIAGTLVLHALADRARSIDGGHMAADDGHALFVSDLVDVCLAAALTPPSHATRALLAIPGDATDPHPLEQLAEA
jgi:AcrR family transcriptional regulator